MMASTINSTDTSYKCIDYYYIPTFLYRVPMTTGTMTINLYQTPTTGYTEPSLATCYYPNSVVRTTVKESLYKPKNWRWFHVFRKTLEYPRMVLPKGAVTCTMKVRKSVSVLQQARLKRRKYVQQLYSAI